MGRTATIRTLALLLLLAADLRAQQYVFRAYRQAEGLKNLAVKGLAVDRSGFLWVGTENGVYRFLGSGFEEYGVPQGIPEHDIQQVFIDPNGGVWAGTYENLYRWDGQRFAPAGKDPIRLWGTRRMVAEDPRHLLVVDKNQLRRLTLDAQGRMQSSTLVFSAARMAASPDIGHLTSVNIVGEGRQPSQGHQIWMGCGKKLCSWSDSQSALPSSMPEDRAAAITFWGTDKGVPEDFWYTVLIDRQGTLWAVGQHHVIALPAGASRFVDRSPPDTDPTGVYRQNGAIEDRAGRVIVATEEGLARWNGLNWQTIGPANGLRISHVTEMAMDAAGDLWLGCIGHGIVDWVGYGNWEGWTDQNGLPSAGIWTAKSLGRGQTVIGTEKGPAQLDLLTGTARPLFSGAAWRYGQVSTIGRDPDGALWAGTFSGAVLRIDPRSGRVEQTAKLPELIFGGVRDPQGRLFFLTGKGVYEREADAPHSAPRRLDSVDVLMGVPDELVTGCVGPDGSTWVLADAGVLREKDGQWTMPAIENLPKLGGTLAAMSCAADGSIWVTGQQTGTWRLTWTLQTQRLHAWLLPVPPEMRPYSPLAIVADRRGWVWLGTDDGLTVWNGHEWRHLTQESGLIWNDVNQGALDEGQDGSIFVGTTGGLTRLVHPERVFDPVPLAASITDLRRDTNIYPAAQSITLPWASMPLRLQISSPAMRNRSELVFSYRMEGLQQEWTDSRDGSAIFSALPPGNYTFSGRAFNPSLNAFSPAVTVQVTILPPWWRNGWMLAVYAVALMLLVALADWLRARHLRRLGRQLQRLVAARTQELEVSREQLRIQATHDGLTGLLNRAAILRALATEIDRAGREGKRLAVALADIDHFKQINDTHGHLAGDEALRQFANAMKSAVRPYDHVGRYGGEEFLLILTDLPEDFLHQRLSTLHAGMTSLAIETPESTFPIHCSLGGIVLDPAQETIGVEVILTTADIALYDAKAGGRNCAIWRNASGTRAGLKQTLVSLTPKSDPSFDSKPDPESQKAAAQILSDLQETVSLSAPKD